ncbi:hypothetical protein ABPG74_010526 [Tetrahymena malaccensis]
MIKVLLILILLFLNVYSIKVIRKIKVKDDITVSNDQPYDIDNNTPEGLQIPYSVKNRNSLFDQIISNCISETAIKHKGGNSKDTQIYDSQTQKKDQKNTSKDREQ